ncbi:hypothetical protein V8C37DRAFT_397471 [Trichoderma ceciliae]
MLSFLTVWNRILLISLVTHYRLRARDIEDNRMTWAQFVPALIVISGVGFTISSSLGSWMLCGLEHTMAYGIGFFRSGLITTRTKIHKLQLI